MACSVEIVYTLCRQQSVRYSPETYLSSEKRRVFGSALWAPCIADHSHRWTCFTPTPPKEDTGALFGHMNYFCLKVRGSNKWFWKFLKSQAQLWLAGAYLSDFNWSFYHLSDFHSSPRVVIILRQDHRKLLLKTIMTPQI